MPAGGGSAGGGGGDGGFGGGFGGLGGASFGVDSIYENTVVVFAQS